MSNNELYSYRNIVRVAVPIIIGGIAQNVVSVTDTIFLGNLSESALGAAVIKQAASAASFTT